MNWWGTRCVHGVVRARTTVRHSSLDEWTDSRSTDFQLGLVTGLNQHNRKNEVLQEIISDAIFALRQVKGGSGQGYKDRSCTCCRRPCGRDSGVPALGQQCAGHLLGSLGLSDLPRQFAVLPPSIGSDGFGDLPQLWFDA